MIAFSINTIINVIQSENYKNMDILNIIKNTFFYFILGVSLVCVFKNASMLYSYIPSRNSNYKSDLKKINSKFIKRFSNTQVKIKDSIFAILTKRCFINRSTPFSFWLFRYDNFLEIFIWFSILKLSPLLSLYKWTNARTVNRNFQAFFNSLTSFEVKMLICIKSSSLIILNIKMKNLMKGKRVSRKKRYLKDFFLSKIKNKSNFVLKKIEIKMNV